MPALDHRSRERIKVFHGDDATFQRWIDHYGGYVLTSDPSGSYMVHDAECSHIATGRKPTTAHPVRWAQRLDPLLAWVVQETGGKPVICRRGPG